MIAAANLRFLAAPTAAARPHRASPRRISAAYAPAPTPLPAASPSLYDVLGVAAGAPAPEIKAAYRRLARTCHPDVAAGDSSAEEFMRVHQAYSTLSDPDKRADYDRQLILLGRHRHWQRPAGPAPFAASPSGSAAASPFSRRRTWETDQCW